MKRSVPRVVFFQANFPTSIDYPNARPVRRMQQRGLDVQVVTFGPRSGLLDGVRITGARGLADAAVRLRQLRPDLLFIETPTTSLSLAALGRIAWVRSPVLSTKWHKAVVQSFLARYADYVTFCNPADERRWHLPPRRILDLPYPVDVAYWREHVERHEAWWSRRNLEPPSGPVIAYVANLWAPKRQPEAVAWLAPLMHQRPTTRFVLAGRVFDPQVASDVDAVVRAQGLADRIHVVGELSHDDVRELYAWADVAVINSPAETQCMSLYEALAAGVPAVVRNSPNLTSAFPHLPSHGDGESLRENIVGLLDDPKRARRLVEESQPRVEWADVDRHDRLLDEHLDRILSF